MTVAEKILFYALIFWGSITSLLFCLAIRRAITEMLKALEWQRKCHVLSDKLVWMTAERDSARQMLEFERNMRKFPVSISVAAKDGTVLDDKTVALVRLAVNNPEKNEGANAAMLAGKRLAEKISTPCSKKPR